VFIRSGETWIQSAMIEPTDSSTKFGHEKQGAAICNDTALVGAPHGNGVADDSGAAYILDLT